MSVGTAPDIAVQTAAEPRRGANPAVLTLAAGLLACVPVIASVIRALAAAWIPVGDRAIIATRAYDVLSGHPPLLGQYSAASGAFTHQTHSLGPMLYWLLAIPAHFLGAWATPVTMGLVNSLCVLAVVALAQRRGGAPLMLATALALVVMTASLPAEIYHDSWNPSAGVLPLALLIFLSWSLWCGEIRLLALTLVVASFLAQCHLTFALPALLLLLMAVVGLSLERAWRRTPLLIGTGVAAVCWVAPVLEQIIHSPGNFATVARSVVHQGPVLGWTSGWRAVERTVGIVPWWLRARGGVPDRLYDMLHPATALAGLTTIAILLALAAVALLSLRRRQRDVAGAAISALLPAASVGSVASSTPSGHLLWLTLGYTLWWGSVAGMWTWVALVWGASRLIAPWRLSNSRAGTLRIPARAAAASAFSALVLAAVLVCLAQGQDLNHREYRPVRQITAQLIARLPHHDAIELRRSAQSFATYDVESALLYQLRRHGETVLSSDLAPLVGTHYRVDPLRSRLVLYVSQGVAPTRGMLAQASIPGTGMIRVQLLRAGLARGSG